MRSVRVEFDGAFPEDSRELLLAMIRDTEWLLPSWVENLIVDFMGPLDNRSMSATISEEYRRVRLTVHPEWLIADMPMRRSDLRHEFIHINIEPIYRAGAQAIDLLSESPQLHKWAREELRLGVERATCDLEYALARRVPL